MIGPDCRTFLLQHLKSHFPMSRESPCLRASHTSSSQEARPAHGPALAVAAGGPALGMAVAAAAGDKAHQAATARAVAGLAVANGAAMLVAAAATLVVAVAATLGGGSSSNAGVAVAAATYSRIVFKFKEPIKGLCLQ